MAHKQTFSLPRCFGILYDIETQECQACLMNEKCQKLNDGLPPDPRPISVLVREEPNGMPETKNERILAVCKRYGIPPIIRSRAGDFEVTAENLEPSWDLAGMMTTKDALHRLLTVKLGE